MKISKRQPEFNAFLAPNI